MMEFIKTCEYCGGPDHAVGLCHAVAAVEYRNGDVVKRVEFDRSAAFRAAQIDWLDVRAGIAGIGELECEAKVWKTLGEMHHHGAR